MSVQPQQVISGWMGGVNPDRLSNGLKWVLDTVVKVYAAAGVPLPERQIITVGEAVADCEQVSVSFMSLGKGLPGQVGDTVQRCNSPSTATVHVQVIRCVPVVGPGRGRVAPTPEQLEASTEVQTRDAWLLMMVAEALEADLQHGGMGMTANIEGGSPQGGFAGPILTLEIVV